MKTPLFLLLLIILLSSCAVNKKMYRSELAKSQNLLLSQKNTLDHPRHTLTATLDTGKISSAQQQNNGTPTIVDQPQWQGDTTLTFASWRADRDFLLTQAENCVQRAQQLNKGASGGFFSLSLGGLALGAAGGIYGLSSNNKAASVTSILTGVISGALALFNFDKNRQNAQECFAGTEAAEQQFADTWSDANWPQTATAFKQYQQARTTLINQMTQPACLIISYVAPITNPPVSP